MKLTGKGNVCPYCGKEFCATQPLTPNVTDREFYGGRVKFFKDVVCDCTAEYRLCIEPKYDAKEAKNVLKVIDMIVLKEGLTKEEREKKAEDEINKKIETETQAQIHSIFQNGKMLSLKERQNIKKEVVLANIVDLDTKIETLCMHTQAELLLMCRMNKVKCSDRMSKKEIAKALLVKNPNLVEANPNG